MLQVVSLGGGYKSPVCTQYFAERDLVQSVWGELENVSLDEFAAYIDEHYPPDAEDEHFMRDLERCGVLSKLENPLLERVEKFDFIRKVRLNHES